MTSIVGIRKLSLPNIRRQSTDAPPPMRAEKCFFVLSPCSTKTGIKSAVRAKSMPVVLKLISEPATAPSAEPYIH